MQQHFFAALIDQPALQTAGRYFEEVAIDRFNCISLALLRPFPGNHEKARACHETVLRRRKKIFGEVHIELAGTMNNLGLVFDQIGEHEKALEYYQAGLHLKKKHTGTVWSVVNSLSNVANKYTSLMQFDEAKRHLDEAMDMLNKTENPHKGALSLIHNSYGKMYRAMGDHAKAAAMFGIAVDMRRDIMMDSIPYIWSAIQLANVLKERKQFSKAISLVNDILKRKDGALKRHPQNDFVLECLKLKADIYKQKQLIELLVKVVDDTEVEICRLRDVFTQRSRMDKVQELEMKLQTLRVDDVIVQ